MSKNQPRRNYTQEERAEILKKWEESGVNATEFAKTVGISQPTLYVWRKAAHGRYDTNEDDTKRVQAMERKLILVKQWRASGLSAVQFAKERKLGNPQKIYAYQNYLRAKGLIDQDKDTPVQVADKPFMVTTGNGEPPSPADFFICPKSIIGEIQDLLTRVQSYSRP